MPEIDAIDTRIIKQVQYYFSDVNLIKDRFMKIQIEKDDGWVPFSVLLTFNRLNSLTKDSDHLKQALSKATDGFLEVRQDAVKRAKKFNCDESESIYDKFADETLYVKGFGSEVKLEDIESWFQEIGYQPTSIHMRKFPTDKKFKGSIFATFEDKETAAKFLKCEEAAKFKGCCMIRKWQKDFKAEKDEERNEREKEKKKRQELQEKARKIEVENSMVKNALLEIANLPPKELHTAAGNKRKAEDDDNEDASEQSDPKKNSQLFDLKQWVSEKLGEELSKGMWLSIEPDSNKGIIRLKTPDSAKKAEEILEQNGLEYKGCKLQTRILDGDEEFEYWSKFLAAKGNKSHKRNQGHGKRRRRAYP